MLRFHRLQRTWRFWTDVVNIFLELARHSGCYIGNFFLELARRSCYYIVNVPWELATRSGRFFAAVLSFWKCFGPDIYCACHAKTMSFTFAPTTSSHLPLPHLSVGANPNTSEVGANANQIPNWATFQFWWPHYACDSHEKSVLNQDKNGSWTYQPLG